MDLTPPSEKGAPPILRPTSEMSLLLNKIFRGEEKRVLPRDKQWKRQDISQPAKEAIEQFKSLSHFLPLLIQEVSEPLKEMHEEEALEELYQLLDFQKAPLPIHLLDIKTRLEAIKKSLIEILKNLNLETLNHLQSLKKNPPFIFRHLIERIQIEKELEDFVRRGDVHKDELPHLFRQALCISEPQLAFKIVEHMPLDILRIRFLKNIIHYYLSQGEIDEALKIIIEVPNREAKMQLIKALSQSHPNVQSIKNKMYKET